MIGSGGFSGVNYYYDSQGNVIGTYYWDDMVEPNEPKPPVLLEENDCTLVKESKPPNANGDIIPLNVVEAYGEAERNFNYHVTLQKCVKNDGLIYAINQDIEVDGPTSYYDKNGVFLEYGGRLVRDENFTSKLPSDFASYACDTLNENTK